MEDKMKNRMVNDLDKLVQYDLLQKYWLLDNLTSTCRWWIEKKREIFSLFTLLGPQCSYIYIFQILNVVDTLLEKKTTHISLFK